MLLKKKKKKAADDAAVPALLYSSTGERSDHDGKLAVALMLMPKETLPNIMRRLCEKDMASPSPRFTGNTSTGLEKCCCK